MDAELHAKWERIEGHLRAVLAQVNIGDADNAQVKEFLDHNEFGVAFEWIVNVMADRDLAIPSDARQHLAAASTEMQLGENPDWQRLQARD